MRALHSVLPLFAAPVVDAFPPQFCVPLLCVPGVIVVWTRLPFASSHGRRLVGKVSEMAKALQTSFLCGIPAATPPLLANDESNHWESL